MGRTFFQNLNGSNCHLGGQAIISLCHRGHRRRLRHRFLSPWPLSDSPPSARSSTPWRVESRPAGGRSRIGGAHLRTKTWRRRGEARGTPTSPSDLLTPAQGLHGGSDHPFQGQGPSDDYPPKFWSRSAFITDRWELSTSGGRDPGGFEIASRLASWRVMGRAAQLRPSAAGSVSRFISAPASPTAQQSYMPVDKPAMTAVREVASWSGPSVMLDHNGALHLRLGGGLCQGWGAPPTCGPLPSTRFTTVCPQSTT